MVFNDSNILYFAVYQCIVGMYSLAILLDASYDTVSQRFIILSTSPPTPAGIW